jgi:hypothetical protein
MFRATRSSADDRQITTTLQQVLSSERPINHQRGARCQRQIGAGPHSDTYSWFTEGLDTPDLKQANALLKGA